MLPALQAPIANFIAPSLPNATEVTTFTNTSVQDSACLWTFGDGATSTQRSPSHTYAAAGRYVVRLCVSNSLGLNCKSDSITVVPYLPFNQFIGNYTINGRCIKDRVGNTTPHTADTTFYTNTTWTITRPVGTDNLLMDGNTYKYVGGSFDFTENLGGPLKLKFRSDSVYFSLYYYNTSGTFADHTTTTTQCSCKGKKQ